MPRNIDLDVARHVAVAMSHAADCLPTLRKVGDTSPFLATCCETFCCAARDKAGMSNAEFFCDLSAASSRECCLCICQASRSTEAPPGTGYTGFDEGPRGK